ncbi:MAG: hypothetical protein R8P61_03050 [Bacteroidia bacterium]|nr:hypothetical protein [Bacteroidia bacterium]
MDKNKKEELAALFMQAGKAHHHAYIETDGDDPEWPLWYSEHLKESLPALLGVEMTRSRIIYELMHLDDTADTSKEHWTEVYAETLLAKYSA